MVTYLLPIEPMACPRPRIVNRGQYSTAYMPKKYREWKAEARALLKEEGPILAEEPVAVYLHFRFTALKSEHRKRKPANARWRPQKPDIDNLVKAALDVMNGIAFVDDAQVVRLFATKQNAGQNERASVLIEMEPA
jgi:Holliday junction resolvase RusA-like endonuclease